MRPRKLAKRLLNAVLRPCGYEIVASPLLYDWQRQPQTQASYRPSALPKDAADYLRPDHPRLLELQERYAAFDRRATAPLVWQEGYVRPEDMRYFRGDNAYVWQQRGLNMSIVNYALTAYYAKSIDRLGLLETLTEDGLFGNFTFPIADKLVSRDLLDSIFDIDFLEQCLGVSSRANLNVLDIGAGYGRLAHRMLGALPSVESYLCTDAVAVSTFLCEYYLRFRQVGQRAKAVALDEIDETLRRRPVDLAVNIHSFSECRIAAIDWWLGLLEKHGVRHLMVAPNMVDRVGERLLTNDGKDFGEVIRRHGYRLAAKAPKYRDPVVQQYAIHPTHYHLFELR